METNGGSESERVTTPREVARTLNSVQAVVFLAALGSVIAGAVMLGYELDGVKVYLGEGVGLIGFGLIAGPTAFGVLRYLIWRTETAQPEP